MIMMPWGGCEEKKNGQDPGSGGLAREREKREGALLTGFLVLLVESAKFSERSRAEFRLTAQNNSTFRAESMNNLYFILFQMVASFLVVQRSMMA